MQLYITDAKVPELASLNRAQRKLVREGAFRLLCGERPSTRWVVGLLGGIGAALGFLVAVLLSHLVASPGYALGLLGLGAVVGGEIGYVVGVSRLTERLRPYFRRFIQEHPNEINSAA
jgi:hypothetical protein